MSRSVSIFSVVVVMTVTVLATVAVAFAVPGAGSNGQAKVPICHKGHEITVAAPAWPAHLKHGDAEGACTKGVTPEPVAPEPPEDATLELTTVATPEVTLGQPISDMATLSGATSATGTITFNAYGPDDEDCSGGPAFTSDVDVEGDGEYSSDTSDDFVPDAAGTYRWTAEYIGDTDNETETASSECNAPGETSVVNEADGRASGEPFSADADFVDPATDTTSNEGTTQNDNTTLGTDSDDHLYGDSSANILLSRQGHDFLDSGQGPDRMVGGKDSDKLYGADGEPGNDVINGGIGTDYCVGDVGDDFRNCDGNVAKVPLPSQAAAPAVAGN